ncbi:MAG: hypothetical protein HN341_12290 [Verrucomicrobia bacterium]|jgi:hypothetical protein|nr:hypothetical protein [Verrucomicrobiota bacterium]
MSYKNYLIALLLPIAVGCAAPEQSILQWSPEQGVAPKAAVEVQWFKDNDFLSPEIDGVGKLQPLSAVMDTFCGESPELRREFSDWVSEYELPKFYYHPAHPKPEGHNLVVSAYHTPYECYQTKFLKWMKNHRGQDDFLLPAARKVNTYRGDLVDPVVDSPEKVTEELLRKTSGCVIVAEQDKITFIGDNRYNPLRWICPINEIHHREQPSWAMRLHTRPELWSQTGAILKDAKSGKAGKKFLLRYEIALQVEDCREELGEYTFRDYLKSGRPGEVGLIKQMHDSTLTYAGGASRDGVKLLPIQQKMVEKYLNTRLAPINLQVTIGINFRERRDRYRLAEFMLCSYNQKPVGVMPAEGGGKGFLATACDALNPLVTDGGNNGHNGWWRMPISVLSHEALTGGGKSAWSGTDYLELQRPELKKTVFKGEIDVTEFYRQSLAANAFPGQRGLWVDQWVGFEGDAPESRDPDEEHGIEWAFFIFESHGPIKTVAEVRRLDLVMTP